MCAAVFTQTAQVQPPVQTAAGQDTGARVDETTLPIGAQNVQPTAAPVRQNTVWLFVRMVVVLALVVAAIYALVALLRRGINPPQKADPYLKSVASVVLGPGRSVQVITVGAQAFLIGVSENAVNLIGELNDKELIDAMNLNAEREGSGGVPRDFASLFSRFLPPTRGSVQKKQASASEYFSAAEETQDYLRRRREEFRAGENAAAEDENENRRP